MCGFFCVLSKENSKVPEMPNLMRAGRRILNRGPDDEGTFVEPGFGVYFCRLSIIDTTSGGHQPMISDDKRLVLVFNGEIYNYKELRSELVQQGYSFNSDSDTEVLLKSFQRYGLKCVDYLRGMFAFAIWDREKKKLYVFRDRLGIKPLYIFQDEESILLSSEIKCILEYTPESKKINQERVFKYLSRGWVDDCTDTFYHNINAVAPSFYLIVTQESVREKRYWSLPPGGDREFDVRSFQDEFTETISLHLRSDVPLATTLSGGMDSPSIVGAASKIVSSPEQIQAFSVVPPHTVDESSWINATVKHTKVHHSYLSLCFERINEVIDDIIKTHDEPFQASNCIYQYLIRKEVALKGVKVLLVGEGGDEVLGGYRRFIYPFLFSLEQDKRMKEFDQTLKGAIEFLEISGANILLNLQHYKKLLEFGGSGQENTTSYDILTPEFVNIYQDITQSPAYPTTPGHSKNYFYAHLRMHLLCRDVPYILRMEDRNSMAKSIESRVPFFDHKFIEYVFSHDYREFIKEGKNKSMLRRSMDKYLPQEVIQRKSKSPRPGNNSHLIYHVLYKEMIALLRAKLFKELGYFKTDTIKKFQNDCLIRNKPRAITWFRIYILLRWFLLKTQ